VALAQGGAEGNGSGMAGGSSATGTNGSGMTSTRPSAPSGTTGRSTGTPYNRKNDSNVYQDQQRQGDVPQPPNAHGG
jgi:hypothetical protein